MRIMEYASHAEITEFKIVQSEVTYIQIHFQKLPSEETVVSQYRHVENV